MPDAADTRAKPAAPPFPRSVRAAGLVWLGLSVAWLAGAVAYYVLFLPLAFGAVVPPVHFIGLGAVAFAVTVGTPPGVRFSVRVLRGRVLDVGPAAMLSLAGGVVLLMAGSAAGWAAVWAAVWAAGAWPGVSDRLAVAGAALFALGVGNAAAGTLGRVGARRYRVWRRGRGLPTRRPRADRHRYYDDENDSAGPRRL